MRRDDLPADAALCATCVEPFITLMNGEAVCLACGMAYPREAPAWPSRAHGGTTYAIRAKDKRGRVSPGATS